MKMCESICERFEVPLEKFPILASMKKQAAVRYHLSKYLREKPETNEYKGLDRVIELFLGLKEVLCYACQLLWQANRQHEAAGIAMRNHVTPEDFVQAYEHFSKKHNYAWIGQEIAKLNYRKEQDY